LEYADTLSLIESVLDQPINLCKRVIFINYRGPADQAL